MFDHIVERFATDMTELLPILRIEVRFGRDLLLHGVRPKKDDDDGVFDAPN
jgi:hypothetical protein